MEEGRTPNSWKDALISLSHKQETEINEIKNFRPISLLNSDYKIFASVLATRLRKVLAQTIFRDQAGFLPKRQIKDYVRIMLDVLEFYELHIEKNCL